MKARSERVHWFLGILCILIIITVGVIVKETSLKTGLIMGSIVVAASPFILYLSERTKKHDGNIHYRDKNSKCYNDTDGNCVHK
jgi:hypothetical protein